MAQKDPKATPEQEATLASYRKRVARPTTVIVLRDGRVALRIHGSGARADANFLIRRDGEPEADQQGHAKKALDSYLKRRRREAPKAVALR